MGTNASCLSLQFLPVAPRREETIAYLKLNRPAVSNALNGTLIEEMTVALGRVRQHQGCRALVLSGEGKHFCAGADLDWMRQSAALGYDENIKEAEKLSGLFATLYEMPLPTIALVNGAAFGGGVGLVACCDWAIALPSARFCLSEVKVGLVAAVILPYLSQKMPPAELRRLVMTAAVFGANEAAREGLVQKVANTDAEAEKILREDLRLVLAGEPSIQKVFKLNHRRMLEALSPWRDQLETGIETIANARISPTGQAGIKAFLEKRTPDWVVPLDDNWKLP